MCGIRLYKNATIQIPEELKTWYYKSFQKISWRWPDYSVFMQPYTDIILWFHRLAIIDRSILWNQPFIFTHWNRTIHLLCNGEIYNYKKLIDTYKLEPTSWSDCEVIWLLYIKLWFKKTIQELQWEFACIIIDSSWELKTIYAARDRIWVRPLFYNIDHDGIFLSSELKWIPKNKISEQLRPWTILIVNHDNVITKESYFIIEDLENTYNIKSQDEAQKIIYNSLYSAVEKRLMSDRPLWCLLSWGLDSSLIVWIASKLINNNQKLHAFTIGLEWWTDLPFAKKVAEYTWVEHHIITLKTEEALQAIQETIYAIESYDITTVRASIRQYLLAKHISKNFDIKVLLCWELSDELLSGYKYFHNAPNSIEMNKENIRLVKDVHKYDWLRTDRTMAHHWLEVRLPFADEEFIEAVFSIDPELRMPQTSIEKYLLRKSFDGKGILPDEVLRRSKEAFSDGVSSRTKSRFELLQEYIETLVSDDEFNNESTKIIHNTPKNKEAYFYRKVFTKYFGEQNEKIIPYFRLPRWSWNIQEPSARVLQHY